MNKIILATKNPGKVFELRSLLRDLPVRIVTLIDFPEIPEILEDGSTFEENALKKAEAVFKNTGIPSLADDSGLEVYALNMLPGVLSARYAGEKVNYAENNQKLLSAMSSLKGSQRRARFYCSAAFVCDDDVIVTEGLCKGTITDKLRGNSGFGYDPLFMPDGFDKTFAEMSVDIKNKISHRSKAFLLMIEKLKRYFL